MKGKDSRCQARSKEQEGELLAEVKNRVYRTQAWEVPEMI